MTQRRHQHLARAAVVCASATFAGGTLILALACGPVPLGDGPRLTVIKGLTSDVITPTLAEAHTGALALEQATVALEATHSPEQLLEQLLVARTAWKRARLAWKASTPFQFGPGKTLEIADAIDWAAIDPKKLDEVLASADPLTDESVALLGASRRGFHALEWLLFAEDAPALLFGPDGTGSDPASTRRLRYVHALATDIVTRLAALQVAWANDFAGKFAGPGQPASPYPNVGAAIDVLVNETLLVSESALLKLAKPLGLLTGGEPRPDLEESPTSDHTLDELLATVRGVRLVFLGRPTSADPHINIASGGISAIIKNKSPGLDQRVRAALTNAELALAAVPRPLRVALVNRDPSVAAAHQALRELKRLLGTELVGALGATLKFNDNDGD